MPLCFNAPYQFTPLLNLWSHFQFNTVWLNFRLFIPCIFCTYCNQVTTDATVYFVKNLFPLFLPYMFRALITPSSGVSQAVFYIQPFGSRGVYVAHLRVPVDWFVVVVSLYWCRGGSPVLVARHTQSH